MFNTKVISKLDSGFTLVCTIGVCTISKFDGGFGMGNIKTVRIMGSHVGGGTAVENPVMFKNGISGGSSNESTGAWVLG